MNVARRDLHHLFDVPTTFPDHVRVLCIGHVHLQSHLVYLEGAKTLGWLFKLTYKDRNTVEKLISSYSLLLCYSWEKPHARTLTFVSRTSSIFFLASTTLSLLPSTFTCGSMWKLNIHLSRFVGSTSNHGCYMTGSPFFDLAPIFSLDGHFTWVSVSLITCEGADNRRNSAVIVYHTDNAPLRHQQHKASFAFQRLQLSAPLNQQWAGRCRRERVGLANRKLRFD